MKEKKIIMLLARQVGEKLRKKGNQEELFEKGEKIGRREFTKENREEFRMGQNLERRQKGNKKIKEEDIGFLFSQ